MANPIRGTTPQRAASLSHSQPVEKPRPAHAAAKAAGWAPKAQPQRTAARTADSLELAPKSAPGVPAAARDALTLSLHNWRVDSTDVGVAFKALEPLSMPDYQAALGQLEKDGLLEKLVGAMDPSQRNAFLDQAARKGAIQTAAGEKAKGPFDPPATPRLYVQSKELPPALRRAAHEANLDAAGGYNQSYRAYVDRYAEGVMQQPSREAIKKLGPPAPFRGVSEPGLQDTLPGYRAMMDDWVSSTRTAPDSLGAWAAISNRMCDLTGETRPGSFWLQAEVEVVKKDGPMTRGMGVDLTVRDYGQVQLLGKRSVGLEAGGEAAKAGAKLEVAAGVKLQRGVPMRTVSEVEVAVSAEGGKHGGPTVGVEASSHGDRELTMNLGGPLGSYAKGNSREATFEGGVTFKQELRKDVELEARVGAGFKAITAEEVERAIDPKSKGFFGE